MTLGVFGRLMLFALFSLFTIFSFGQLSSIELVDKTVKIGSLDELSFYYSFCEGDEIIFSFSEDNGKPLKEIEISEEGGNVKFADFKVSQVDRKVIKVHKTGVYGFRLYNGALKGRICSVHIERRPKSELTVDFNTNWEWKKVFDTTYFIVQEDSITGYDTTYNQYTQKELLTIDTSYLEFTKNERVHTRLNPDGDISILKFNLPNQYRNDLEERKLLGWAYWFGTDGPPEIGNMLKAARITSKVTPIAGLALGLWAINKRFGGRNLNYAVLDGQTNARLYYSKDDSAKAFDWGDGSSSSKQFTGWYPRTFYLGFDNDHTYPVDVDVIVSVVMELKKYHYVDYLEEVVTPQIVVLDKKRMKVTESQFRSVID